MPNHLLYHCRVGNRYEGFTFKKLSHLCYVLLQVFYQKMGMFFDIIIWWENKEKPKDEKLL